MFNSLMGSIPLIMCEKEILPNKKWYTSGL